MKQNFWQNLPKPFFALAPMDSVSDIVFRHVVAKAARPDIFFTEFTNAASFCSVKGRHSTRGRLSFSIDELPIVAQIWGTRPEHFAEMAQELAKKGFSGIDINMGCPDKNVVKTGGGSALIRTPELAQELVSAAKTGGLPVSVKTRLGYSKPDEFHTWLELLLQQNLANLTVHLRTRKEMSKVDAHYELIPEIKKMRDSLAPRTLLTINGDVADRVAGENLAMRYQIDGIMIGRGIFANPFVFEKNPKEHTKEELFELLNLHLDLHDKYSSALEPRKFDPLKHFFKVYIRNFDGASELRDKLMHATNTTQVRDILKNYMP